MKRSELNIIIELRDLMNDVMLGDYTPDSFTNQPINLLIEKLQSEIDDCRHEYDPVSRECKCGRHIYDGLGEDNETNDVFAWFNDLKKYKKWDHYEKLQNVKWVCGSCGCDQDEPRKCGFVSSGSSICCNECEEDLTVRHNGGQHEPFNWVAIHNINYIRNIKK